MITLTGGSAVKISTFLSESGVKSVNNKFDVFNTLPSEILINLCLSSGSESIKLTETSQNLAHFLYRIVQCVLFMAH